MVEPNGDAAGYAEFMAHRRVILHLNVRLRLKASLTVTGQKRSYMAKQGEARRFWRITRLENRGAKKPRGIQRWSIDSATYNGKTYANDYETARLAEESVYRRSLINGI